MNRHLSIPFLAVLCAALCVSLAFSPVASAADRPKSMRVDKIGDWSQYSDTNCYDEPVTEVGHENERPAIRLYDEGWGLCEMKAFSFVHIKYFCKIHEDEKYVITIKDSGDNGNRVELEFDTWQNTLSKVTLKDYFDNDCKKEATGEGNEDQRNWLWVEIDIYAGEEIDGMTDILLSVKIGETNYFKDERLHTTELEEPQARAWDDAEFKAYAGSRVTIDEITIEGEEMDTPLGINLALLILIAFSIITVGAWALYTRPGGRNSF